MMILVHKRSKPQWNKFLLKVSNIRAKGHMFCKILLLYLILYFFRRELSYTVNIYTSIVQFEVEPCPTFDALVQIFDFVTSTYEKLNATQFCSAYRSYYNEMIHHKSF